MTLPALNNPIGSRVNLCRCSAALLGVLMLMAAVPVGAAEKGMTLKEALALAQLKDHPPVVVTDPNSHPNNGVMFGWGLPGYDPATGRQLVLPPQERPADGGSPFGVSAFGGIDPFSMDSRLDSAESPLDRAGPLSEPSPLAARDPFHGSSPFDKSSPFQHASAFGNFGRHTTGTSLLAEKEFGSWTKDVLANHRKSRPFGSRNRGSAVHRFGESTSTGRTSSDFGSEQSGTLYTTSRDAFTRRDAFGVLSRSGPLDQANPFEQINASRQSPLKEASPVLPSGQGK